jgi:hypothetical protein
MCAPFVDPALTADHAPVFWDPHLSRFVLRVAATQPYAGEHAKPFDLGTLQCTVHFLRSDSGEENVLFLDRGRRLQLHVTGSSLHEVVCLGPLAAQVALGATRRGELVRALDWVIAHGTLPQRVHRAEAGAHRLLFILLALDGARQGAAPRDIARLLFGESRVQHHWADGGRAMRAQIHRAVERGEWLCAGGYRALLE